MAVTQTKQLPLFEQFFAVRRFSSVLAFSEDGAHVLPAADGVSKHEATVRAIRDAAARRGHRDKVAELSAEARVRYADLLDRLGR